MGCMKVAFGRKPLNAAPFTHSCSLPREAIQCSTFRVAARCLMSSRACQASCTACVRRTRAHHSAMAERCSSTVANAAVHACERTRAVGAASGDLRFLVCGFVNTFASYSQVQPSPPVSNLRTGARVSRLPSTHTRSARRASLGLAPTPTVDTQPSTPALCAHTRGTLLRDARCAARAWLGEGGTPTKGSRAHSAPRGERAPLRVCSPLQIRVYSPLHRPHVRVFHTRTRRKITAVSRSKCIGTRWRGPSSPSPALVPVGRSMTMRSPPSAR